MIDTPRILLRRFELNDAPAVYEFGSNKQVQRWTSDPLVESVDQAREIIEGTWFSDYEAYGYGRFAAYHKADRKVIGFAGLKYLPEAGETDLGYRILPEYWNQGLTTEMSTALIDYGFETLQLPRIVGFVLPENGASARVLQKSGLQLQKRAPYPGDDEIVDWYSIENPANP